MGWFSKGNTRTPTILGGLIGAGTLWGGFKGKEQETTPVLSEGLLQDQGGQAEQA